MFYIFTGDGKGKTTAALGQALRACGDDKKVLMVQFIKGPWPSGEDESHKKLLPNFELRKRGLGFVGILNDALPRKDHEDAACKALKELIEEGSSHKWDIVIADEINNALDLELIKESEIQKLVDVSKKKDFDLIFTGRGAKKTFLDQADLVTEMRDIKHPLQAGTIAKRGIEY